MKKSTAAGCIFRSFLTDLYFQGCRIDSCPRDLTIKGCKLYSVEADGTMLCFIAGFPVKLPPKSLARADLTTLIYQLASADRWLTTSNRTSAQLTAVSKSVRCFEKQTKQLALIEQHTDYKVARTD